MRQIIRIYIYVIISSWGCARLCTIRDSWQFKTRNFLFI